MFTEWKGRRGIDVSEHNGPVDWAAVRAAGMDFAVLRLGYGRRHLDDRFRENLDGAAGAGLALGVYYYSYALDETMAGAEARFLGDTLAACDLVPGDLPLGVWLDMEDADGFKARCGLTEGAALTELCRAFVDACGCRGYPAGVYASLDWLENRLDMAALGDDVPVWCAQWTDGACDWPDAALWQYTDGLEIGSRCFDGNVCLREVRS
ncbi:MAG: hypothetical protein IJS96_05380 [Schwartzia sp.]|nr:hypothetical protein [Schwartzia sp. (in: firmicutes)]